MSNPLKAISRAVAPITGFFERNLIDPVSSAISRAVTPPDNGASATAAAISNQTAALQRANDIAEQTAKDATARAAAASLPVQDSESARRAAEDRIRKLRQSSGFTAGGQTFGAAPLGFRVLSGA